MGEKPSSWLLVPLGTYQLTFPLADVFKRPRLPHARANVTLSRVATPSTDVTRGCRGAGGSGWAQGLARVLVGVQAGWYQPLGLGAASAWASEAEGELGSDLQCPQHPASSA